MNEDSPTEHTAGNASDKHGGAPKRATHDPASDHNRAGTPGKAPGKEHAADTGKASGSDGAKGSERPQVKSPDKAHDKSLDKSPVRATPR